MNSSDIIRLFLSFSDIIGDSCNNILYKQNIFICLLLNCILHEL